MYISEFICQDFVSLLPDMFEYEGPLDLTEYYIRKTELRSESADLLRVEVDFKK